MKKGTEMIYKKQTLVSRDNLFIRSEKYIQTTWYFLGIRILRTEKLYSTT